MLHMLYMAVTSSNQLSTMLAAGSLGVQTSGWDEITFGGRFWGHQRGTPNVSHSDLVQDLNGWKQVLSQYLSMKHELFCKLNLPCIGSLPVFEWFWCTFAILKALSLSDQSFRKYNSVAAWVKEQLPNMKQGNPWKSKLLMTEKKQPEARNHGNSFQIYRDRIAQNVLYLEAFFFQLTGVQLAPQVKVFHMTILRYTGALGKVPWGDPTPGMLSWCNHGRLSMCKK